MQKIITLFSAITIMLLFFGCSTHSPSIVGKWVGNAPDNVKVYSQFETNNSLVWTVKKSDGTFSMNAKYSIDDSTEPIQINIYEVTNTPIKDFQLFGIIKFKGNKKMLFYGESSNNKEGKGMYPKEFGSDSIEFLRVK